MSWIVSVATKSVLTDPCGQVIRFRIMRSR